MKLVINNCYGGMETEHKALRADPEFIAKVEAGFDGKEKNHFEFTTTAGERKAFDFGRLEHLIVVEIPDESTDYYIEDYDGVESVIYVVDGKIHVLTVEVYEGQ